MAGKVNALGQVWSVPDVDRSAVMADPTGVEKTPLGRWFWNELSGRTPGTPWFS
jgi:hypothetical protein